MKKRLFVCGDSWSQASKHPLYQGTHWSELLAEKLDWELDNLSIAGCSNTAIRLQLVDSIKQKADFVIFSTTFTDRMEVPIVSTPTSWISRFIPPTTDAGKKRLDAENKYIGDKRSLWNLPHDLPSLERGYNSDNGFANIDRYGTSRTMISRPIRNMVESTDLNDAAKNALKYYVTYLYDPDWKKQLDEWVITEGALALYLANIPFSIDPLVFWNGDEMREKIPALIDDKFLRTKEEETILYATTVLTALSNVSDDPGYHGTLESQIYIADMYYKLIKETWKL